MYGHSLQPWYLSETVAMQQRPLMQSFSENKVGGEGEEAEKSAGGFPLSSDCLQERERKLEVLAMALATAANSPPQSSADDIFSDTMELASYLHRRVQEIGKQFYHRPFRINTNEKGEFLPGFLQGLPCASKLPLGPSSANFQKACNPAELRKNTEKYLQREEWARPLAEEKRSSRLCSTSKFSPGLSGRAEMMECMAVNLYDNFIDEGGVKGCMREHLHDSMPDEARTCYRLQLSLKKGEDAQLPTADREEFFSEMASSSPCSTPPLANVKVHILPSTQREEQFSVSTGNPTSFACYTPQLPSKGSGTCDSSLKGAADLNFSSFQEDENQNISVDAVNCPAMALRLPSMQDHVTSNAENAWVLSCMQKEERDCGNPENCASRVISHILCHGDLLEGGEGDTVFQVGKHRQNTPSQEVAENPPPAHSHALRCVSSVDSSECDNCGTDAAMGNVVTDGGGSRNSNGTSANNSVEIDAMREAVCFDPHGKDADADADADVDNDETIVVAVGGETSHKQETKTDALDLLLDAIQVTSGGVFAGKEDTDATGLSALHTEEHVLGRNADTSLQERKVSKIVQTNGSSHLDANAPHDIEDNTLKGETADFFCGIVHFPAGRFPIVRKRSYRCSKTVVKKEANSVATVVRFKSLQAVSEVNHFNNRRSGKEPAANKQEQGAKVLLSKMQEGEETIHHLQSGSNGKRGKDWEKKQESAEKEDQFSKRARHADADDLQEGRAKGQMLMMPASEGLEVKGEEEQVSMSRRARSQILPCKFSDSVLQPWKKRDRRKS